MDPLSMGIGGLANVAGGLIGGRARRQEQRAARAQMQERMTAYENMQFTNPYANMQNTMEDLTVNTQQADFLAQQQQQGLANTMGALQGAAGGSGIAALAQAMSNQQSQKLQQSSASIGLQESQDQMAAAQQGAQIQQLEAQGEGQVQQMELGRNQTLLGMSQQRLASADAARAQATNQLLSGVAGVAGGVLGGVAAQDPEGFLGGMMFGPQ
jgi:hypothetical protein